MLPRVMERGRDVAAWVGNPDTPLFRYPAHTRFDKAIPKETIYGHSGASRKVRELFVQQVQSIRWLHKLSPETLKLPARDNISEIQIIVIELKGTQLHEAIARTLDQITPSRILFELRHGDEQGTRWQRSAMAYKRPAESNAAARTATGNPKPVIGDYFASEWRPMDTPRADLPTALDMAKLYAQLLRAHWPFAARANESLRDQAARIEVIQGKHKELKRVEAELKQARQFNRRVEINARKRALRSELARLTNDHVQ